MMRTIAISTIILIINVGGFCQKKENNVATGDALAGVWTLVAVENILPDSTKVLPYGSAPAGMLVFNTDGSYAIQILKTDRPKVAANDKNKATAEENAALVQGCNTHFGRYVLDVASKKITFYVDHAFYPNWEGTIQERTYAVKNDMLKYVVTQTTNGGAITALVTWQRKR